MQTAGTSDKYARLERFLDNMESVTNPDDLNEPFRTLWFRIHGLTVKDIESGKGVIYSSPEADGIEVAPSKGLGAEQIKGKGRIEVVSPKDVGPTLEMVVEEKKKVTFKAASGEDLETVKLKEQAAKVMVDLQQKSAPLKGMGGEGSKLFNQIREVAILYRDDEYMDAMKKAGEISKKMDDDEFKKNLMVYLQKKIKEYQDIGGDLKVAQERFKEMAVSFKEHKDDFIMLAGAVNKLCEDSIKDLISDQVVAEVEIVEEEAPAEQPVVKIPLRKRITTVKKSVKETPELAPSPDAEAEEKTETAPQIEADEEIKSVIKVVKKKIVLVPEEEEGETEDDDFTIDDIDEEISEPETADDLLEEKTVDEPQVEPETVEEEKPVEEKTEEAPTEKAPAPEKSQEAADLEAAFNKIQFVYNVSLKMHNGGKDVSQLFDMITYAETVRQKGETKTYLGVANQLESMLISMQNEKS